MLKKALKRACEIFNISFVDNEEVKNVLFKLFFYHFEKNLKNRL